MIIKNTFLELTTLTYPNGCEDSLSRFLPNGYYQDIHGNYYYKIENSKTAFTCHLDTVSKNQVNVNHVIEGDIIKTDGKSILGADDKAGMTVLLYMIEKRIPGLYCFFVGEEVGCIGSGLASKDIWTKDYDRMVSFDRRGTHSVITHQSSRRCCSDIFAEELSLQFNLYGLNMSMDDTGVYTDSAEFVDYIPECTNISVGYYNEHSFLENQDISHLEKLCEAAVKVNWDELPVARNKDLVETKSWNNYHYDGNKYKTYDDYDEWKPAKKRNRTHYNTITNEIEDYDSSNYKSKKKRKSYYNSLDNEIFDDEIIKTSPFHVMEPKNNCYLTFNQIIFDANISPKDWESLKDQFLEKEYI